MSGDAGDSAERDALLNYGVAAIGDGESLLAAPERTYVVLGVSRGGTSAAAGLLHYLGVNMGPTGEPPLFEDLRLNRAIASGGDDVDELIARYNASKPVWGFKGNAITEPHERFAERLRNPVFLVIFRDLLAIANRAHISAGRDVAAILQRQAREYQRIIDFIAAGGRYAVLLSYEKLCLHPAEVVDLLAPLCGLEAGPQQRSEAARYIEPAPEDYLRVSRAKRRGDADS